MASENVVVVSADNFDSEVLQSEVPVFVDFWAPWCGPCKMLGPVIDQLADEYAGKAKVAKIDIETDDATKQIAIQYGVQGIPALMMFKDGEKVAELVGGQPKPALAGMINNALA
ncbi:MAG TPA: thioredoxin [Verrucomicrobiales bacterium]|nr:thioredoxin [Verrucomicrobiales bacterium]|tara:strand:+ start:291 stop:632 length:342 start_codon:yes stop_codon:yes gene_type:complete